MFSLLAIVVSGQSGRPLIIAHRGASGEAPENTIASIRKALFQKADVIEIDVHLTKDNKIIVMHDITLDRTTNLKGLIKDYNWAEIIDADAGGKFSSDFKGEKIPTFQEVLTEINGKAKLLIEIKTGGDFYPGIEQKVVDIIAENKAETWCLFHSFSDEALKRLQQTKTQMPIYKLVLGNFSLFPLHIDGKIKGGRIFKYKQFQGINPNVKFTRKRTIRKIKAQQQQVFVWTVNKEKDMKRLAKWGVDGIITNYPGMARKVVDKL